MPFYFQHGQSRLALDDMPLDAWVAIQEATGKQWHEVLSREVVGDAKVAKAVIAEACKVLGVEVPPLTLKTMLEVITFESEPIVPEQYTDGVPDPKAPASDPATT